MSSALNESSALQCLNVVMRSKYANGIRFDFNLELPHITSADPPGNMHVCQEIYQSAMDKYIMVRPTSLHCVQIKHLMRN